MRHRSGFSDLFIAVTAVAIGATALAQQPAGLFFREEWKVPPKKADAQPPVQEVLGSYLPAAEELPLAQEAVTNTNLELKLYGAGRGELKIAHIQSPPIYVWSGIVHSGSWAVTLRDKSNYVDLSSPSAKIRWKTREAGFHQLRPVLRLADGTLLVGDYAESYSADWKESEIALGNVHWRGLDADRAVESPDGKLKDKIDLSKVDEVGFTDLTIGAGHGSGGASRVNWVEVYGTPVRRGAK